jgi:hypothetical protein
MIYVVLAQDLQNKIAYHVTVENSYMMDNVLLNAQMDLMEAH